jgi:hypothetical protein
MICANPSVHVENLNPLPSTNDIVDKCIECGFCEPKCTSRNITTTLRLRAAGEDPASLNRLGLRYQGKQTCAVDGLCAMACPGSINTGDRTKYLRNVQLHQDATCGEVQSRCSDVRGKSRRAVKAGFCGFAGDRGFMYPESNASALAPLKSSLPGHTRSGYSNSRTCGIGLSLHSGISYQSLVSLVGRCTTKKTPMPQSETRTTPV